jgi:hypothetical protein
MVANIINQIIINEMREMSKDNKSFITILNFLINEIDNCNITEFIIINYLYYAFCISIPEAKQIRDWNYFNGGHLSDNEIEMIFKPLIEKKMWKKK